MNEAFQSALNILLVEDDKDLAGFIREGLEDESCAVRICFDGASGLLQAEIHSFDIILLDVMLPGLNGFEVTKRLRLQNVRTPILLLTARDAPEDKAEDAPVMGEREDLRRLFVILLDNAIKYSEAGSIIVTVQPEDGLVKAAVADMGTGIEKDALPHVFDRFWRADKVRSRAAGGAGLGLSLASQIVRNHGGTIFANSEPGRGSKFVVELKSAAASE